MPELAPVMKTTLSRREIMFDLLRFSLKTRAQDKMEGRPSQEALPLTVYHFRGHDSLSLAVFNGIVLWGAADQTGTQYCVPLPFERIPEKV
jgi:hypothetical protein